MSLHPAAAYAPYGAPQGFAPYPIQQPYAAQRPYMTPQPYAAPQVGDTPQLYGSSSVYQPWFCPNCGTRNAHDFCPNCGTKRP